jgi:serine/threonine protein phosphatase PrpC
VSWRGRNPAATKINQDAVVVAEHARTGSLLLAVFDGHGVLGREVSCFFKERFPVALFTDARFLQYAAAAASSSSSAAGAGGGSSAEGSAAAAGSYLQELMTDVLLATEKQLIERSDINCALSGTTAVVILLRDGLLHTINVGDSRALLAACSSALVPVSPSAIAGASATSTATGNPCAALTSNAAAGGSNAALAAAASAAATSVLGAAPLSHASVRLKVLTVDHKPDMHKEKARILAAGGRVMATRIKGSPNVREREREGGGGGAREGAPASAQRAGRGRHQQEGQKTLAASSTLSHQPPPLSPPSPSLCQLLGPARVWLKNAPVPGLNMSRSLGDLTAKLAGVISTPHKASDALSATDRVLVLASDGLWDFVANEEVATLALSTGDCWEAASRLARLARARWLVRTGGADDTTVVVVRLAAGAAAGAAAAPSGSS